MKSKDETKSDGRRGKPESKLTQKADSGDPIFVELPRPHWKPGTYELLCQSARYRAMFGGHKCELKFMNPLTGDVVFKYLHMGRENKPKVTSETEYYKAWVIANNGKRPAHGQRPSMNLFVSKFFEVEVGDVTKRHDGNSHTEPYSVVKRIIRRTQ